MRVLLVSQRFPPARMAGSELQVQMLANGLHQKGVDVRILTTLTKGDREPLASDVPIDILTLPRSPLRPFLQWLQTWRFLNRSTAHFDIVHCHCISPTSLAALQFFRRKGVPVILQPSLGGKNGEFEKARVFGLGYFMDKLMASADGYAVLNKVIHNELLALGINNERLHPTLNAVDIEQFQPLSETLRISARKKLGLPQGQIVLFVGQLIERKGVLDLLEAWPQIHARHPDASLVFVGNGTLAQTVGDAAEHDESIVYLGEQQNIHEIMQVADLLSLPSYNESFGCVLTEAMACGLPVIAGRTGLSEIVSVDKKAGLVITAGDADGLQQALLTLLADPQLRSSMGQSGMKLASTYSLPAVVDHVISIYREKLT